MRWIRLDACFDESWLFSLSAASQLAWIKLLCTVKRDGIGGKMKALSPVVAARKWGVGDEDVSKMLEAARKDGAVEIENGEWRIVNWAKFQDTDTTSAERQKRFRQKAKQPIQVQNVTDSNGVTTVTNRNACRVTETETETETENKPPKSPNGDSVTVARLSEFKAAYPKRAGTYDWPGAEKKFLALVKSGEDPERIIAGVKRYAAMLESVGKLKTEYVMQPPRFLNSKAYEDEFEIPDEVGHSNGKPKVKYHDGRQVV